MPDWKTATVGISSIALLVLLACSSPQDAIDGLEYVWIPPGSFQMGCVPRDDECSGDEKPQHPVKITKGFWMGRTETTVKAYKKFVQARGLQMPKPPSFNPNWEKEDHPIVRVNWHDAEAYCEWAGGRLPTEAEWEYASRDNPGLIYPWGNEISPQNASYAKKDGPLPVRSYAPTGLFGLYDMAGNVWEWCSDSYDANYYAQSPEKDPQGPSLEGLRVLRGGSWVVSPRNLRTSYRAGFSPLSTDYTFGVRCAREVPLIR